MKLTTLCFLVRSEKVALPNKKRGFGKGFLNGYGGKVQEGETPELAIARELREEAGLVITPSVLEKAAVIDFYDGEIGI